MLEQIRAAGDRVRELKNAKVKSSRACAMRAPSVGPGHAAQPQTSLASPPVPTGIVQQPFDEALKGLQQCKADYKALTGQDAPAAAPAQGKVRPPLHRRPPRLQPRAHNLAVQAKGGKGKDAAAAAAAEAGPAASGDLSKRYAERTEALVSSRSPLPLQCDPPFLLWPVSKSAKRSSARRSRPSPRAKPKRRLRRWLPPARKKS